MDRINNGQNTTDKNLMDKIYNGQNIQRIKYNGQNITDEIQWTKCNGQNTMDKYNGQNTMDKI